MKHTTTKLVAMLLVTMMILAFAVPMVNAETTATTTTYPTYEEANAGELLYKLDFSGDGRYDPTKVTVQNASYTVDSADSTKATLKANATKDVTSGSGGPISGLPLNENSVYTIDFTTTRHKDNAAYGTFIYFDSAMQYGFAFTKNQASYSKLDGNTMDRPAWKKYTDRGITIKETSSGNNRSYYWRVVVDAPAKTMRFYVLGSDNVWAAVTTLDNFTVATDETNLNVIFGSLQKDTVFSDVKIYKGHADGGIRVDQLGELLLEVGDVTEAQTGAYGITYTPNINSYDNLAYEYSYDNTTDTHTITTPENLSGKTTSSHGIGGNTNLILGYGQKYTITYKVKLPTAATGRMGVRYSHAGSYANSQGSYVTNDGYVTISHGANTAINGSSIKIGDNFKSNDYNEIAIELDGYNVTVYVNGVKEINYSSLNNDLSKAPWGYSSDLLAIVLYQYDNPLEASVDIGEYKDIKVYSGLTVSNNYVEINDGGVTEIVAIESDEYTLPSMKKVGYVFNGWKVTKADGTEEMKPSGTTYATADLRSLEAVYTKVMSENWYQFRAGENGEKDIRIVSVIDSLNYEGIGYTVTMKFTANGEEKSITKTMALKTVYESVTAKYGTELVTLETLGFDKDGGYLTSFVIGKVPAELGNLTVELTPYQIGVGETEATVGETVTYSIDLVDETVSIK